MLTYNRLTVATHKPKASPKVRWANNRVSALRQIF